MYPSSITCALNCDCQRLHTFIDLFTLGRASWSHPMGPRPRSVKKLILSGNLPGSAQVQSQTGAQGGSRTHNVADFKFAVSANSTTRAKYKLMIWVVRWPPQRAVSSLAKAPLPLATRDIELDIVTFTMTQTVFRHLGAF